MRRLAIRRRREWPEPPATVDVDLELANALPADSGFLTGNGVASWCRHVLNYGPAIVNDQGRDDWYFVRADYAGWFLDRHAPRRDFVLFTHNSDYPIGPEFRRALTRRRLRAWFAANAAFDHPKLLPLPAGIANPRWPHGDAVAVRAVYEARLPKTELFDASYSLDTNSAERLACAERTGIAPAPPRPYREYLVSLAASYFCLSPRGYGIDTHRTWEALYLRTVPVVTRSLLTERYPDLPMVVLDSWDEFPTIDFSPELYERVRGGWDPAAISLDGWRERVERALA